MRKILLTMVLGLLGMLAQAQPTTVYFDYFDKDVSLGLGNTVPGSKITFGIMQHSKKKEFDDFSIRFINSDGEEILKGITLEKDTVFHFNEDKLYSHEADFLITPIDLNRIFTEVKSGDMVIINGEEYSASAFVGVLRQLQKENSKPAMPGGFEFRNPFRVWYNPQGMVSMILMREKIGKHMQYVRARFDNKVSQIQK